MDVNYNLCFRKVKDELNSLNFRHLTVFGKLTFIKRLFLPKFTHVVVVISNLSLKKIHKIEAEFENFIKSNSPPTVDKNNTVLF